MTSYRLIWGGGVALLLVALVGVSSCFPTPTDPRIEDPCYSLIVYIDSLTLEEDSSVWEWTPGECNYEEPLPETS